MKIIQTIRKIFGSIIYNSNIIHEGIKVLHISDTPTIGYNAILKLIMEIKPDYIIHTGDLADNIKLEIYPEKIDLYKARVKKFILTLDALDCDKYIVIGNHDDRTFIENTVKSSKIIEKISQIKICDKNFLLTHKLEDLKGLDQLLKTSDYILHGHSYDDEIIISNIKVLNGLDGIYLIYPSEDEIHRIDYPIGTNDSRMQKFSLGI